MFKLISTCITTPLSKSVSHNFCIVGQHIRGSGSDGHVSNPWMWNCINNPVVVFTALHWGAVACWAGQSLHQCTGLLGEPAGTAHICSLAHSRTCFLIWSPVQSYTHPSYHSFNFSFAPLTVCAFIHSFIYSFVHWCFYSFVHWFVCHTCGGWVNTSHSLRLRLS